MSNLYQSKLEEFRSEFFKTSLVQLNNAGLQPISKSAHNKINYWSKRFYEEGFNTDQDYMKDVAHSRQSLANLIGCESSEIAFFTGTSGAVSQLAFNVGLSAGDEVLMWDQEFASHLYPWKAACDKYGAKLVLISSEKNYATPTEKMIAAITPNTKVITFSWVQFISGAMMDNVEELIRFAKSKNILIFADIIQGLGFQDCHLWQMGIDAVVGGSHKWLFSPVGVGYLAIRQELINQVKPHVIGAMTFGTCDDPSDLTCEPKKDALKYEPGSKQVLEITALGASIDVIHRIGVSTIQAEALRLAKILRIKLLNKGYTVISPYSEDKIHSTPFVNFEPKKGQNIRELSNKLNEHKVFHAIRGPGIRFTTQAFNTENDIDSAIDLL